jgi:DNA invertase Pin-like site-specific DNA recombinase
MLKNGKSAAIYCRTASGAAKDEFEIHDQEGALLAFAERQGYSNPVAYIDNACSGLTLERPAFSRLTADIRGGRIAAVVMRDLSRVGRDYPSVCGWIEWAKSQGVDIVTLRDHPAGLDRFADLQI